MKTIQLSSNVMVSDPCYSVPTWCQTQLDNVLAGKYYIDVQTDEDDGRNYALVAVHEDYVSQKKRWYNHGEFGVDSGQAGIFDMASYRNDEIAESITTPEDDFTINRDQEGDEWYIKMCKLTLATKNHWGSYDRGVVSSSGWGDGSYPLKVQRDKGRIVGICLDFGMTDVQAKFLMSLIGEKA